MPRADRVSLEGDKLILQRKGCEPVKATLNEVANILAPRKGGNILLPDGVKIVRESPNGMILVHQSPPSVRRVEWMINSPKGPGFSPDKPTVYKSFRISLPYVLLLIPFRYFGRDLIGGVSSIECFFRNEPLKSIESKLCYPALLNIARYDKMSAWVCPTGIGDRGKAWRKSKDHNAIIREHTTDVIYHLFCGKFNYDIRGNWFSNYGERGIDPRISTIEAWEEATKEDPTFSTEVSWIPHDNTLDRELALLTADCLPFRRRKWDQIGLENAIAIIREEQKICH